MREFVGPPRSRNAAPTRLCQSSAGSSSDSEDSARRKPARKKKRKKKRANPMAGLEGFTLPKLKKT